MRNSLKKTSTESYRILNNVKAVRLINVLQYFWESEEKLSPEGSCTSDCETYQNMKYDGGDGCFGSVRDCQFKISVHHTEYQLLQGNGPGDRIYEGYSLNDKWYGLKENSKYSVEKV